MLKWGSCTQSEIFDRPSLDDIIVAFWCYCPWLFASSFCLLLYQLCVSTKARPEPVVAAARNSGLVPRHWVLSCHSSWSPCQRLPDTAELTAGGFNILNCQADIHQSSCESAKCLCNLQPSIKSPLSQYMLICEKWIVTDPGSTDEAVSVIKCLDSVHRSLQWSSRY